MSKVKVQFLVPTIGIKAGDVKEFDKAQADYLVENGHAVLAKDATPKSEK